MKYKALKECGKGRKFHVSQCCPENQTCQDCQDCQDCHENKKVQKLQESKESKKPKKGKECIDYKI